MFLLTTDKHGKPIIINLDHVLSISPTWENDEWSTLIMDNVHSLDIHMSLEKLTDALNINNSA